MGNTLDIETLDHLGRFSAYESAPVGTPRAAIIVIQEIFGVNPGIRRKCDTLAEMGYLAIAPDLFWRIEPGIQLDPDQPDELRRALALMPQFDQDKGILDIEATIRTARHRIGTGKIGAVGYCLGGRLAYLSAARTDVDAAVGYYAVNIPDVLNEQHAIAHPLLLHIAGADHFVSPEMQQAMHDGLNDNPKVVLYDYPGVDHGFATEFGKRRDDASATMADQRTQAFFAEHLG